MQYLDGSPQITTPDKLQGQPILVGPEVRDGVGLLPDALSPGDSLRHDRSLFGGRGPVLDTWPVSDRGVPPGGDVADRVDVAGTLHQTGGVAGQPAFGGDLESGQPL